MWNDSFPGPLGTNRSVGSLISYPVEVNLPTTVDLAADISLVEESGIRNFNLTGFFFAQSESGERTLVLDFQMYSRWPNNLTFNTISSLPFTPDGPIIPLELQGPNLDMCNKTAAGTYSTDSMCWQFGSVSIPLGSVCNVSGPYTFAFASNCFRNAATSNCLGTTLTALALIEGVDLCSGLYGEVAQVQGNLTADKPDGYFFGDTVVLTATFESLDVPLFETRLMSADVTVAKDGNATKSLYTVAGGNAELGRNTNFTIAKDGLSSPNEVLLELTPNMMPTYANAFLSVEDFDTRDNDFSFALRFRVFFDAVSAGRTSVGRRLGRRRWRDIEAVARLARRAPSMGTMKELSVRADSSMVVPNATEAAKVNPGMVPAVAMPTPTATPAPESQSNLVPIVLGVVVGLVVLLCACGVLIWCAFFRKDKKKEEPLLSSVGWNTPPPSYGSVSTPYGTMPVPTWNGVNAAGYRKIAEGGYGSVAGAPDVSKMFAETFKESAPKDREFAEEVLIMKSSKGGGVDVSNLFGSA
jgi:hypothetical protein